MLLRRSLTLAVTGLCLLGANAGRGQDADSPGLKVGQKAPEFELLDQQGQAVSLQSLLRKKNLTALVFYRSASW